MRHFLGDIHVAGLQVDLKLIGVWAYPSEK